MPELPHAGSLRRRHRGGARAARAEAAQCARRRNGGEGRVLDELEAYALLDRLGVPRAPAVALDDDDRAARPPCPSPIRSP